MAVQGDGEEDSRCVEALGIEPGIMSSSVPLFQHSFYLLGLFCFLFFDMILHFGTAQLYLLFFFPSFMFEYRSARGLMIWLISRIPYLLIYDSQPSFEEASFSLHSSFDSASLARAFSVCVFNIFFFFVLFSSSIAFTSFSSFLACYRNTRPLNSN